MEFDINRGQRYRSERRVIAREQSAVKQPEKVVGAAGLEGRGPVEDAEDTEHNGQAVWPPGGPREHRTSYLARSMGRGLGARGPVRNIAATDRR